MMEQNNQPLELENELETEQNQSDQTETPQETTENISVTMEELLAEDQVSLNVPRPGELRTGVIVSVARAEVLVSIGAKSEGIIPAREMMEMTSEDRESLVEGSEIQVVVVNPEDNSGNLILSYSRALEEADWQMVHELKEQDEVKEGLIVGYNKGGLMVQFGRLQGFVPASQISPARRALVGGGVPDQRWTKLVGEKIITKAIEVDRERRRLILSELAALQEARDIMKDRLLETIKIGDVLKGRVTSLAQFGAFVNIDGADGLVHLTEVSWERIKHPGDSLKIGQEVDVKVISIDTQKKRIGLSVRQLLPDPWPLKVSKFREGQLVEGKIVRLTKFGAFARIDENVEGLLHISEISEQRIEHPKEVLKESDVVTLRILNIDVDQRRIALSLRRVHSAAYADLDMQMAMEEISTEEVEDTPESIEEAPEVEEVEQVGAAQDPVEEKSEDASSVVETTLEVEQEPTEEVEEAVEEVEEAPSDVETTLEVEVEPTEEVEEAVEEGEEAPSDAETALEVVPENEPESAVEV